MKFFTKKHRTLLWRAGLCAFAVFTFLPFTFAVLWACAFVFLRFCCYGRFARLFCPCSLRKQDADDAADCHQIWIEQVWHDIKGRQAG